MIKVVDKRTGEIVRITSKEWHEHGAATNNKRYSRDLTWKKTVKRVAKKKVVKTEE